MFSVRKVSSLSLIFVAATIIPGAWTYSKAGSRKHEVLWEFTDMESQIKQEYHDTESMQQKLIKACHFDDIDKFKELVWEAEELYTMDVKEMEIVEGTPLTTGCVYENALLCVKHLLKMKANFETPNENGLYPIHVATNLDTKDMFKTLVKGGVDWRRLTDVHRGQEPISSWFKVCRGKRSVDTALVGVMLKEGQDPSEKDAYNMTCAQLVKSNPSMYKLLKNYNHKQQQAGKQREKELEKELENMSKEEKRRFMKAAMTDDHADEF